LHGLCCRVRKKNPKNAFWLPPRQLKTTFLMNSLDDVIIMMPFVDVDLLAFERVRTLKSLNRI